jgi:serine/threonine-protein kinase
LADIGSVLGGRYRLIELLGQGGMATIYRARDHQLERDVAVKVLRPEYGRDPDFFARFRQEAQSAASLNHPNVVAVYDYGTDEAGPFIVMELVDGEDLATILKRSGPLPPRQAARIAAEIARAIAAAHDRGFVHRDIKPGNVLVTREGRAKVTDFGIARAVAEAQFTLPGTTIGSVHYFSPEQARGEPAGPASDIYSLGIVLYELLTGRRPWEGDSAAAIATARLTGPVPSPSAVRAGIPSSLEAIDRKALALRPEDRFASAAAMAEALERYLAEERPAAAAGATGAAGVARGGAMGAAVGAGATGAAGAAGAGAAAGVAGAAASGVGVGPAGGRGRDASARPPGPETVASATARPNAARLPYADDAYADAEDDELPARGSGRGAGRNEPDQGGGPGGPWLWVSAILALAILAVAGYLAFQFLAGGPGETPGPNQVDVPNFVDMTFTDAQAAAENAGLKVIRFAFEPSQDKAVDTVLSQDPAAGTAVDEGSTVKLTLALGQQSGTVPDLRLKTESEALNLIVTAGFGIGDRTEEFDSLVPADSIIRQDPGAGLVATKGIPINYVVSKGPEPTPSPTPSPTPTPTPIPTPPPTPTPAPTPTPTPGPRNVGNYICMTLAQATAAVEGDGFVVDATGETAGQVVSQSPAPGTSQPFGATIHLTFENPPASTSCPPG